MTIRVKIDTGEVALLTLSWDTFSAERRLLRIVGPAFSDALLIREGVYLLPCGRFLTSPKTSRRASVRFLTELGGSGHVRGRIGR
jgi:hypothetical protein